MEEAAWRCDAAETILLSARSASQLTRKLYCRESRVGVQEGKLHTSPQQQGDGLKEERGGNRSISNGNHVHRPRHVHPVHRGTSRFVLHLLVV